MISGLKTDKPSIEKGLETGILYFSSKPIDINEWVQRTKLIFRVIELEKSQEQLKEKYDHFFSNTNGLFFVLNQKKKQVLKASFNACLSKPAKQTELLLFLNKHLKK